MTQLLNSNLPSSDVDVLTLLGATGCRSSDRENAWFRRLLLNASTQKIEPLIRDARDVIAKISSCDGVVG
jgi:hypothetical protein